MAKEGLGLEITELRLGLPGGEVQKNERKRIFSDVSGEVNSMPSDHQKFQGKSQVVGWPPVCSYRRKNSFNEDRLETCKRYVKISMDGAPFLRKIDLGLYKDYADLAMAMEKLFGCFGISKALEDADGCEYVPIYEDKEGDWMLVGDVPWHMFTEACTKLRIMKRSEAKGGGIQPRDAAKGISKDERD